MGNCLVTKLKGAVDTDDIKKLGEFRIKVSKVTTPTKESQGISLAFTSSSLMKISGGYFTDETLTENKGTVAAVSDANTYYVSNSDGYLSVDKYKLKYLTIKNAVFSIDTIDELKYSPISYLYCSSKSVKGDIKIFRNSKSLTYLSNV